MNLFSRYSMMNVPRQAEGGAGAAGAGSAAGGAAGAAGSAGAAGGAGGNTGAGAAGGGGSAAGGAGTGQQQQQQAPWYTNADYGFDDDTKKFYEGKNYPDLKTALTSLRHADQVARERNVLPRPDPAKLNDWEGWTDLGWKADIKEYQVKPPELKQGQTLDAEMLSSFTNDAHELRLPLGPAQELFHRQFSKAYERIAAMGLAGQQSSKDLETALKGEWGEKYDGKVDLSRRAMTALGIGMDDSAELERAIGSPRLVKMFHGIAERLGEDNLVTANSPNGQSEHPEAIKAELNRFEMDTENIKIMNDQRDPRHQQTIDARRKLIERLAKAGGK